MLRRDPMAVGFSAMRKTAIAGDAERSSGGSVIHKTLILGLSGRRTAMTKAQLLRLEDLEADLSATVDRLEAEWLRDGMVSDESAKEVHALLQRALAL